MKIFYFTKNMLQLLSVALPLEPGALHFVPVTYAFMNMCF
jgi:hypothetical protein